MAVFLLTEVWNLKIIIIRLETIISIRNVFADISNFAVEDIAENIQGVGGNVPVLTDAVELSFADPIFVDKLILRDAARSHHGPKLIKFYHGFLLS